MAKMTLAISFGTCLELLNVVRYGNLDLCSAKTLLPVFEFETNIDCKRALSGFCTKNVIAGRTLSFATFFLLWCWQGGK